MNALNRMGIAVSCVITMLVGITARVLLVMSLRLMGSSVKVINHPLPVMPVI